MPGITRIHIQSDWNASNDWRLELARAHEPIANRLYLVEFARLGLDLAPAIETVTVTKQEAAARYDWAEGIDVILRTVSGARMTLQEKFLTFTESTATFEERKTSGAEGAWYYCTAQYYFVGYTRQYWNNRQRHLYAKPVIDFQDWLLLDFPAMRRADAAGRVRWKNNHNEHDGRSATFRYVPFDSVPHSCIVARCENPTGSTPAGWPWAKWTGSPGPGPCKKCTARDYYLNPKHNHYVCRNCKTIYSD